MARRAVLVVVALVALQGTLFAGAQKEDKIYFGLAAPLTGDSAMYGETAQRGAVFAVSEINAAGGIKGKKIELVTQDDKGDPKEASLVAQKLAEDKRLFAVIGHINSSCTIAALPIYEDAGLTVVSPTASSPKITQLGHKNFFRSIIDDGLVSPMMVRHAVEKLKSKRIAIIVANNDYGLGLLGGAKETAKKYNVPVVGEERFVPMVDKDFSVQIAKLKEGKPDVVLVLADYNEAGLIVRQMKTAGMDINIVVSTASSNQIFIDLAGAEAAEGVYLLGYWDYDRPEPVVQKFVQAFKKVHGREPDEREAYAYEIPYILKMAIEKGATKETLPQVLHTIEFTGPTGFTKFDQKGDVVEKEQMVFVVKNGKWATWIEKK